MADFTTVMTDSVAIADSIKLAYSQSFLIANGQDNVMEQIAQVRTVEGAKTINMQKYARLAVATTPLTEKDDAASVAMADTNIAFTPVEFGNVITTTNLIDIQSGGQAGRGAIELVGLNAGQTQNALATAALEASTNVIAPGTKLADGTDLAAGDVCDAVFMNKMFNKLARTNVPKVNGAYIAIMHDDVIADLRAASAAGSWEDTVKYTAPGEALANEVGMYKGFRILRNNDASVADQGGAGTVDVYKSIFCGMNGLGKAVSVAPRAVIRPAYDKLGRFTNVGWYGVFVYGIVDTANVYVGVTASSLGANAA